MLRPELDEPSLKLQREYAGHVLTMRGSVPNADAALPPDINVLHLNLRQDGLVNVGDKVPVKERVPSPPVAAFLGTLPVAIEAERVVDPYNPDVRVYSLAVAVPAGIQPNPTQLRLLWPNRTILAEPHLRLATPSAVAAFDLGQQEGAPEQWVEIGRFDVRPIEVEFGDAKALEFRWQNGVLSARVPYNALEPWLVRVTTQDGRTRRSREPFRPLPSSYGADWVKVSGLGPCRNAAIRKVIVSEGDMVAAGDPLLELETDIAAREMPAPAAGTVRDLRVTRGKEVHEGTPLLRIEPVASKSAPGSKSDPGKAA